MTREAIETAIQQYLANGGTITELPPEPDGQVDNLNIDIEVLLRGTSRKDNEF